MTRRAGVLERSFTLIELLAVIVLLGLISGVGLVSLGSADGMARRHQFDAALQALDREARLRARIEGGTLLLIDEDDQDAMVVRLVATNSGEELKRLTLTPQSIEYRDPGGELLEEIRFDAVGRSVDFVVTRRDGDEARQWQVAGVSGWWRQEGLP